MTLIEGSDHGRIEADLDGERTRACFRGDHVERLRQKRQDGFPIFVYIAGPIEGSGSTHSNCRKAALCGAKLHAHGVHTFIPHLGVAWEMMVGGFTRDIWIEWGLAWLTKCDAVIRLPGASPGSDGEVKLAIDRDAPVFSSAEQLLSLLGVEIDASLYGEKT